MRITRKPEFTNRPKHIRIDDSYYFFTVRTIEGKWLLRPEAHKQVVLDTLMVKTRKYGFPLIAYVILNNHYHIIVKVGDASKIARFIGEINGASAHDINVLDRSIQKVWWNYYDHVIRDKTDFYKHLNYIHQNPVKHSLSKELDCEFSSYGGWRKQKGQEYLDQCFSDYPIVDFVAGNDSDL